MSQPDARVCHRLGDVHERVDQDVAHTHAQRDSGDRCEIAEPIDWFMSPARMGALRGVIEHALSTDDVWFATRREIAQWWLDQHETFAE